MSSGQKRKFLVPQRKALGKLGKVTMEEQGDVQILEQVWGPLALPGMGTALSRPRMQRQEADARQKEI